MHKPFIEYGASGKLRRAIKAKTRVLAAKLYELEDIVYCKRESQLYEKAQGHCLVIGKKYGRVNVCRL